MGDNMRKKGYEGVNEGDIMCENRVTQPQLGKGIYPLNFWKDGWWVFPSSLIHRPIQMGVPSMSYVVVATLGEYEGDWWGWTESKREQWKWFRRSRNGVPIREPLIKWLMNWIEFTYILSRARYKTVRFPDFQFYDFDVVPRVPRTTVVSRTIYRFKPWRSTIRDLYIFIWWL